MILPYKNFPSCVLAIYSVLRETEVMTMTQATIVYALVSDKKLLSYLSKKGRIVRNVEQLVIDNPDSISNFSSKYISYIPVVFNAIQYLNDMDYIDLKEENLVLKKKKEIPKPSEIGKSADKYFKSF
ncbi:hypothetical protein TUMSATVNIG3_12060 [Vibrio nigripulchritudo]|nr:hypothetical protein TUMSATVNIG3_12060 [Vibrio nigripulchritudo]